MEDIQQQAQELTKQVTDSSLAVQPEKPDILQPKKPNIAWTSSQPSDNAGSTGNTVNAFEDVPTTTGTPSVEEENIANVNNVEETVPFLGGTGTFNRNYKDAVIADNGTIYHKFRKVKPYEIEYNGRTGTVDTLNVKKALYELDALFGDTEDPRISYYGFDRLPDIENDSFIQGAWNGLINTLPSMVVQGAGYVGRAVGHVAEGVGSVIGDEDVVNFGNGLVQDTRQVVDSILDKITLRSDEFGRGRNGIAEGIGSVAVSMGIGSIGNGARYAMSALEGASIGYQADVELAERGINGFAALGLSGVAGAGAFLIGASTSVVQKFAHSALAPARGWTKMMKENPAGFFTRLGAEHGLMELYDAGTEAVQGLWGSYIGKGRLDEDDWSQAGTEFLSALIVGAGISGYNTYTGRQSLQDHVNKVSAIADSLRSGFEELCNQPGSPFTMEMFNSIVDRLKEGRSVPELAEIVKSKVLANVDRIFGEDVSEEQKKLFAQTVESLTTDGALIRLMDKVDDNVDTMLSSAYGDGELTQSQRDMFRIMMRGIAINQLVYRGLTPDQWMPSAGAYLVANKQMNAQGKGVKLGSVVADAQGNRAININTDRGIVNAPQTALLETSGTSSDNGLPANNSVSRQSARNALKAIKSGKTKTNLSGTIGAGAMRHEMAHFMNMYSGLEGAPEFVSLMRDWVETVLPGIQASAEGKTAEQEALARAFEFASDILEPLGLEGKTADYMNLLLSVAQANTYIEAFKNYTEVFSKVAKQNDAIIKDLLKGFSPDDVAAFDEFCKSGKNETLDSQTLTAIYDALQQGITTEGANAIKEKLGNVDFVGFQKNYRDFMGEQKEFYSRATLRDRAVAKVTSLMDFTKSGDDTGNINVPEALDATIQTIDAKEQQIKASLAQDAEKVQLYETRPENVQETTESRPENVQKVTLDGQGFEETETQEQPETQQVETQQAETQQAEQEVPTAQEVQIEQASETLSKIDEQISDWEKQLNELVANNDTAAITRLAAAEADFDLESKLVKESPTEVEGIRNAIRATLQKDESMWDIRVRPDKNDANRLVSIAVGKTEKAQKLEKYLRTRYGDSVADRILTSVAHNVLLESVQVMDDLVDTFGLSQAIEDEEKAETDAIKKKRKARQEKEKAEIDAENKALREFFNKQRKGLQPNSPEYASYNKAERVINRVNALKREIVDARDFWMAYLEGEYADMGAGNYNKDLSPETLINNALKSYFITRKSLSNLIEKDPTISGNQEVRTLVINNIETMNAAISNIRGGFYFAKNEYSKQKASERADVDTFTEALTNPNSDKYIDRDGNIVDVSNYYSDRSLNGADNISAVKAEANKLRALHTALTNYGIANGWTEGTVSSNEEAQDSSIDLSYITNSDDWRAEVSKLHDRIQEFNRVVRNREKLSYDDRDPDAMYYNKYFYPNIFKHLGAASSISSMNFWGNLQEYVENGLASLSIRQRNQNVNAFVENEQENLKKQAKTQYQKKYEIMKQKYPRLSFDRFSSMFDYDTFERKYMYKTAYSSVGSVQDFLDNLKRKLSVNTYIVTGSGKNDVMPLYTNYGEISGDALAAAVDYLSRTKYASFGYIVSPGILNALIVRGIQKTSNEVFEQVQKDFPSVRKKFVDSARLYFAAQDIAKMYAGNNADFFDTISMRDEDDTPSVSKNVVAAHKWAKRQETQDTNNLVLQLKDLYEKGKVPYNYQRNTRLIGSRINPKTGAVEGGVTLGSRLALIDKDNLREMVVIGHFVDLGGAYIENDNVQGADESIVAVYSDKSGKPVSVTYNIEDIDYMLANGMPVLLGKPMTEKERVDFVKWATKNDEYAANIVKGVEVSGSLSFKPEFEADPYEDSVEEYDDIVDINALLKPVPNNPNFFTLSVSGNEALLPASLVTELQKEWSNIGIEDERVAGDILTAMATSLKENPKFTTETKGVPLVKDWANSRLGGGHMSVIEFVEEGLDALKKTKTDGKAAWLNKISFFMNRSVGFGNAARNLFGSEFAQKLGIDVMSNKVQRATQEIKRSVQEALVKEVFNNSLNKMVVWLSKTSADIPGVTVTLGDGQKRAISRQEIMTLYMARTLRDMYRQRLDGLKKNPWEVDSKGNFVLDKKGQKIARKARDTIDPRNGGSEAVYGKLVNLFGADQINRLIKDHLTQTDIDAVDKVLLERSNIAGGNNSNGYYYAPVTALETLFKGSWGSRKDNGFMVFDSNVKDDDAEIYPMGLYDGIMKMAAHVSLENNNFMAAMRTIKTLFDLGARYKLGSGVDLNNQATRLALEQDFKKQFKLLGFGEGEIGSFEDNAKMLMDIVKKANQMRIEIERIIGSSNFDALMKSIDYESEIGDRTAMALSGAAKVVDKMTHSVMSSLLWGKAKSMVFNFGGNYAIFAGLSDSSSLKYMTADFVNALSNFSENWKNAMTKDFILSRLKNAGMSDQFERLSDMQRETLLTDVTNFIDKHKHEKAADFMRNFEAWSKKLTKYGVGIASSLPDVAGIVLAYSATRDSVMKMARDITGNDAPEEVVAKTADEIFENYMLQHISNSSYMTRGLVQKKLAQMGLSSVVAFTNDQLLKGAQLANAIKEYVNTDDPEKKGKLMNEIKGIAWSSGIYVAVQSMFITTIVRAMFGDGLDDEEEKQLYQSLIRETLGQLLGFFQYGNLIQDTVVSGLMGGQSDLSIIPLDQLSGAFSKGLQGKALGASQDVASLVGLSWYKMISNWLSAAHQLATTSEPTADDWGVFGSRMVGFSENTALKRRNLRKTDKGTYKKVKRKKKKQVEEDE